MKFSVPRRTVRKTEIRLHQDPIFVSETAMPSLTPAPVDLLIIGGGINGAGIAADAAGRGLSVVLCEQNDLASATSSASSKLIHGGLRYLEQYEFRLVREALREREVLLRKAPHLVHPLRFILPHSPQLRPAWMLRSGLFLYDHLSKRDSLPGSRSLRFDATSPLRTDITRGFEYSDCWVDDARLVITNAIAAADHGARILTRQRCIQAVRQAHNGFWQVTLQDQITQQKQTLLARALINAAGPWVTSLFEHALTERSPRQVRLVQGSHIVVRRFHDYPGAFILQHTDRRIVFVLPYQDDFHLIGTTDREYQGDPAHARITTEEIDYLLKVVNSHFKAQLQTSDIVSHYSGVRPLQDDEEHDPSAVTRDYTLDLSHNPGQAPVLAVFGGKITTYRKLAEAALTKLAPFFPAMGPAWTASTPLPGANAEITDFETLREHIRLMHPWLPDNLLTRFSRSYGLLCLDFLKGVTCLEDLGRAFGSNLYAAEVDYLREREWAMTVDDILWRRTKLGLRFTQAEQQALQDYLGDRQWLGSQSPA